MDCKIEDLNNDGRGRGRVGGKTVLISQALPGEMVRVRPDFATRGTVQGRVAELISAAPERATHPCQHEFHCTGCPLLAAERSFELQWKSEKLAAIARELSVATDVLEPLRSAEGHFGYRHFAKQSFGRFGGRTVLGSFVTGTHHVTSNRGCPVHAPGLQLVLDTLADHADRLRLPVDDGPGRQGIAHVLARQSRATGAVQVVLATRANDRAGPKALLESLRQACSSVTGTHVLYRAQASNVLTSGELMDSEGVPYIEDEILGVRHRIGPLEFFQVNPESAEIMFTRALEALGQGDVVLDLYAGVGVLSLPLLQRFKQVHAVEAEASAVERLRERVAAEGLSGLHAYAGRVESVLPELLASSGAQMAICDPPRKGLGPEVRAMLARSSLTKVVLLACDPQSLVNDVPEFLAEHWRVECVAGVDQFPRTGHVEAICVLSRA
jgi:23S rRNA (uracil1939-C5)-methyltransferase